MPPPERDELLGAWLLRVADLYGLGVASLLVRLAALPTGGKTLHWFAASGRTLHLETLAAAMRRAPTHLAAMAPSACRPRWPEELGFCTRCLVQASSDGRPLTWYRRWMHPLAIACDAHGVWLTPVAVRTLARVRHAMELADLAHRAQAVDEFAVTDPGVEDTRWLQRLCFARDALCTTWGWTSPRQVLEIVAVLARLVMQSGTEHPGTFDLPGHHDQGAVNAFALEDNAGQRIYLPLPTRLRARQRVLRTVGHLLRHPPAARDLPRSWPRSLVQKLVRASRSSWPAGALEWICPRAAELAYRQADLRDMYGCSPRYFRACAALFDSP